MSFQRILEIARQRGLPIIVTDIAGREPVAILPLEEYERLSSHRPQAPPSKQVEAPSPVLEQIAEQTKDDFQGKIDDVAENLSLEEKFYLEPVEDELD